MGQSRPLFVYFRSFLTISIQIEKSIDGVLGIRTQGCRMVGADETTELWRPPQKSFLGLAKLTGFGLHHFNVLGDRMFRCGAAVAASNLATSSPYPHRLQPRQTLVAPFPISGPVQRYRVSVFGFRVGLDRDSTRCRCPGTREVRLERIGSTEESSFKRFSIFFLWWLLLLHVAWTFKLAVQDWRN